MISNRKNTLSGKLKHFCLNLLEKVLLCIFIAVMALITIVSAVPAYIPSDR
jgi:cell division protein FtsL